MQIFKRFLPLAAIALTAFATTSLLRAQGIADSSATPSPDVRSVLQGDPAPSSYVGDPFTKLFARQANDTAAAGGYPASPKMGSSSSSWAPTHFEIAGIAQWRNLNQNVNLSVACEVAPCTVTGPGFNLSRDLGLSGQTPGFLVRFWWTPGTKILGAASVLRVDYGQINRTATRTISREIDFEGQVFPVNAAIQTQNQNKSFEAAYAPEWGNDKFRIGPMFVFQDLIVNIKLTGVAQSSPTPVTVTADSSNFVFQLGFDFRWTPAKEVNVYGFLGAIPCCGGGWTGEQAEFGMKYYFARSFSIIGGVKQNSLTRSFTAGPFTVDGVTSPTVNGSLGWRGWGPFIGATYRF